MRMPRFTPTTLVGLPLLALSFSLACNAITGINDFQIDPNLADAGEADGGAGGMGAAPCTTILDCPGTDDACQKRACVDNHCQLELLAAGTPLDEQTLGDCQKQECDGKGQARTVVDPSDLPNDGLQCTQDDCSMEGVPSNNAKPKGVECTQGTGQRCNGMGACVECNFNADCAGGGPCSAGHCVPPECTDGAKNGNESDIDCGGGDCVPCVTGQSCLAKADCESKVCVAGLCQAATCSDQTANGGETDIDCGGPSCVDCVNGKGCLVAGDCQSGVCTMSICQAPACDDNVKNGSETDLDCGSNCSPCASGKNCSGHADCQSELCLSGKCAAIVQVAVGTAHACALIGDGTVHCWGNNTNGELGDGTTMGTAAPKLVPGLSGVTQISLGTNANESQGAHTCARLSDGTARCWGRNNGGQLGDGTTTPSPTPKPVTGLSGIAQIVAGGRHTCARLSAGSVSCWGANGNGQLGNAAMTNSSTPVSIASITASALALGDAHSCALLMSGEVACWGDGNLGEIGDGMLVDKNVPTPVPTLSNILQIASGRDFLLARAGTGKIYAWGENSDGQLGIGNTTLQGAPIEVAGFVGVASLAGGTDGVNTDGDGAGGGHSCAVFQDGTLSCFGHGLRGQLGTGGITNQSKPQMVMIAPVAEVSLGLQFSCARLVSGALRCWGRNDKGQLGNGAAGADQTTPIPVVFP